MTVRFGEVDHALLRLLTIVRRQSANQIILELLHAEFDRELPGKRAAMAAAPTTVDRLREVLGLPPVPMDPAGDTALDLAIDRAEAEADRIYGEDGRQAA
jgi:hypothetical protein